MSDWEDLRNAIEDLKQTFVDGMPTLALIIAFVTLGFILGVVVAWLS
jgi:hypothetical protein